MATLGQTQHHSKRGSHLVSVYILDQYGHLIWTPIHSNSIPYANYSTMLYYAILCYAMLYYAILYSTILYHTTTIPYNTISYYLGN